MIDYDLYRNTDGTYTSPKNGKIYKSEKALKAHLHFRRSEKFHNFKNLNHKKIKCKFCEKEIGVSNIAKHQDNCYLNPINTLLCKNCNKPIKNYKSSKGTCSRSCANTHFRSGEGNGNWRQDSYQSTCFLYHKKECVECGEQNIVAVHHYDHNHDNNSPENLVPLCPTHHQYMHSRYRHLIEDKVKKYINRWRKERCIAQSG